SWKTFRHPLVVAEIARRRAKLAEQSELTAEWIINRLMLIADANLILAKFKKVDADGTLSWDFSSATPEELAVISGLQTDIYVEMGAGGKKKVKKFKVESIDPLAALNMLARIQGLFNDKVEVQGEISIVERMQKARERALQETDAKTESGTDSGSATG